MYYLIYHNSKNYKLIEYDIFGNLKNNKSIDLNIRNKEFIFGVEYIYEKFEELEIGSFTKINHNDNLIKISTDYSGREPIFYSPLIDGGIFSNSLFLLKEKLKYFDVSIEINKNILLAQNTDYWIFETLAFQETHISNIYLCPLDCHIEIIINSKNYSIKTNINTNISSYGDNLENNIVYLRSLLNAISKNYEFPILSMSGGQDSRIILSALLSLDQQVVNRFTLSSIPSKHRDFEVVSLLSKRYGIPLNSYKDKITYENLTTEQSIMRWIVACYGLNFQSQYSGKIISSYNSVIIRGGQCHASYYPHALKKWLSEIKKVNIDDFKYYLSKLFFLSNSNLEDLIYKHYKYSRYRFHYGLINYQASFKPLTIDPLINPYYEKSADFLSYEEKETGKLCKDLCRLLEPDVLKVEFDKPSNSIDINPEDIILMHKKNENIGDIRFAIDKQIYEFNNMSSPNLNLEIQVDDITKLSISEIKKIMMRL
jgi:hypothetical protein